MGWELEIFLGRDAGQGREGATGKIGAKDCCGEFQKITEVNTFFKETLILLLNLACFSLRCVLSFLTQT